MPLGHQAEWLREWDYAMFARCCEHLPTSQQQHRQHSVRSPMAVSDQDLIECWFGRLTVPEIVKKLDLKSNSELRLQWRRLKDLGKLPPRSREGVDGESGQDGRPATGNCDLLLERLIKVHGEN